MPTKTLCFLTACILLPAFLAGKAYATRKPQYQHFYFGGAVAYGKTTWPKLVDNEQNVLFQRLVEQSVPKSVVDSGVTWGGFIGYRFDKNFAAEATYMRYPNSRITFNEDTLYYPLTEFISRTQAYSLIGKFLYPLFNSRVDAFADAGVGFIRRSDVLEKTTRVTPTFGVGLACNVSKHVMTEVGFKYYAGYGKSEIRPVKDFVPFIYSVYFRLGYRLV